MRLPPLLTASIVWTASVAPVQAAPSSETHDIDRVVQPSAFHGVHGLAFDANGILYAGSVAGQSIYRVDTRTGAAEIEIGAPAGMADDLTFLSDGTLVWTAIDQGVVRARLADGSIKEIASGLPGINSIAQRKTDGRLFAAQVFSGDGLWELDPTGASGASDPRRDRRSEWLRRRRRRHDLRPLVVQASGRPHRSRLGRDRGDK